MLHFLVVLAVGADCSDTISLTATIMIGSMPLEWYPKVPVTDCTRLVPTLSNIGSVSDGKACYTFWPYTGGVHVMWCILRLLGGGCWNLCSALGTLCGMDISTYSFW